MAITSTASLVPIPIYQVTVAMGGTIRRKLEFILIQFPYSISSIKHILFILVRWKSTVFQLIENVRNHCNSVDNCVPEDFI